MKHSIVFSLSLFCLTQNTYSSAHHNSIAKKITVPSCEATKPFYVFITQSDANNDELPTLNITQKGSSFNFKATRHLAKIILTGIQNPKIQMSINIEKALSLYDQAKKGYTTNAPSTCSFYEEPKETTSVKDGILYKRSEQLVAFFKKTNETQASDKKQALELIHQFFTESSKE